MARQQLDLKAMAADIRARARKAQGLPVNIEDPVVLDQLAELLAPARTKAAS